MAETQRALLIALFLAVPVALWNFAMLFRVWVVVPQAEVVGATISFILGGLGPGIALIGCFLRRRWGAWVFVVSGLGSAAGLMGVKLGPQPGLAIAWFAGLFSLAPLILGIVFLRLLPGTARQS